MYNNNNQYYDYMQAGTSAQSYQQQGWYQDQTYFQNFNNDNSGYSRPQNFHHNFRQQQQHKPWINNNKRPHEFVTSPHNGSPEPKMRQIQKRNSIENNFVPKVQSQSNPAFQNMPYQKPFHKINKQLFQNQKKKPPQQPQENPIIKINEERQKDWSEKMTLTLELLKGCKAGEEFQILLSYLQPIRVTWNKIKEQIHNDLMKYLSPLGIEKVLTFGSTLTGLDFHGSDLDYYIQLKNQPTNEDEIRIMINRAAKLSRYLQGSDFMTICTIQSARVPLLRVLHKKSKITCDINFSSRFGYYNSYYIGHVIGYDRRIRDLAIFLKLWSKSNKLASQMVITNYCLMMLMIFYLQNLEAPMLGSIIDVQRSRSPMILDSGKKWNFYFNDSIDKTKNNHQSVRELIVGFFEFYSKINSSEYVISLLTGKLIKRDEFETHPELEDSRKLIASCNLPMFKPENPDFLYVQDGFELNLNIGIKTKKHVEYFFELIKLSLQKCEELKDSPFSELLINLLTEIKIVVPSQGGSGEGGKKSKSKNKNKKKFEMIIHAVPGDLKQCQDILSHENPDKLLTSDDQQKYFFEHAVEYTKKFLKDVYLCTLVPEVSDAQNPFQTRFKVILHVDTINGRKKISFKDENSIKAEIAISHKMAEKKVQFDLEALMVIQSTSRGKTVEIEIYDENSNGKSALQNFGNYFSINILAALRYYLKKKVEEIEII